MTAPAIVPDLDDFDEDFDIDCEVGFAMFELMESVLRPVAWALVDKAAEIVVVTSCESVLGRRQSIKLTSSIRRMNDSRIYKPVKHYQSLRIIVSRNNRDVVLTLAESCADIDWNVIRVCCSSRRRLLVRSYVLII